MRVKRAFLFAGLLGCSAAAVAVAAELEIGPPKSPPITVANTPVVPATPATPLPSDRVTVELTAVTLGEDCGVAPAPKKSAAAESQQKPLADSSAKPGFAPARRQACEQTSMQLSVSSPVGFAETTLRVKKVQVFDENGKLVGTLTPRTPTVWGSASGTYLPWDEKVASAATLSVSYALSAPDWSKTKDRWNKTFTVKAVVTVGGADQKLERDVFVVSETHLPPDVVT